MRVVGQRRLLNRSRDRSDWTRAVRLCGVFFACLAQLWLPVHALHMRGVAAQTTGLYSGAASSSLTPPASVRRKQAFTVPCLAASLALMVAMRPRRANMTIALAVC